MERIIAIKTSSIYYCEVIEHENKVDIIAINIKIRSVLNVSSIEKMSETTKFPSSVSRSIPWTILASQIKKLYPINLFNFFGVSQIDAMTVSDGMINKV